MSDAEKARELLRAAENNSKIGVYRGRAELEIRIAEQYIELAKLEQVEKLGADALDIFDRKQFT